MTIKSGISPSFDGTPGELVTTVSKLIPIPGTLDFLGIDSLSQFESGGVDRVDFFQRISELVDLRSVSRGREGRRTARVFVANFVFLEAVHVVFVESVK